ncbi:proteasome component M29 [Emydomyces testavorans]|uniref:Proteasome component M29 n=1 Tax=Emydomyces testavorans TaxID=2070801 RepID=A0AAF0DMF1_9EURO|nr:proteasome component M29 [Emydomyces testavorans]
MTDQPTSIEARELSLISKVELRIALADSDEKLEALLKTYLAPLLLKLASEHVAVRNKVIALCQHINTRLQPLTIDLPLPALLKQFKDAQSPLVKHFDLIYIKMALDQLSPDRRAELFPEMVQGISRIQGVAADAASAFNLILRSLLSLKLLRNGGGQDLPFREKLGLSDEDALFLSKWIGKLVLLVPAGNQPTCSSLSALEYQFLNKNAPFQETWNSSTPGGLHLADTKVAALNFLASEAFNDRERFIPAVIASADMNRKISTIGDDILKRCRPDLEDSQVVAQLFDLYLGTEAPEARSPACPALQIKILGFLCKSVRATADTDRMESFLKTAFFHRGVLQEGLEGAKLRTQLFHFITWFARMGPAASSLAPETLRKLKQVIELCGWPSLFIRSNTSEQKLRSLAYETIGVLGAKIDHASEEGGEASYSLIKWLFTALSSDISSDEISVSIDQALGSLMNSAARNLRDDIIQRLRMYLIHCLNAKLGEIDRLSGYKIARSTKFAAVRFANRCLPFNNVEGRWINIMALAADPGQELQLVEEGRKGLDPYWYRILNPPRVGHSSESSPNSEAFYQLPQFSKLMKSIFVSDYDGESPPSGVSIPAIYTDAYADAYPPAMTFLRNIFLCEAFSFSGVPFDVEKPHWEERLDTMMLTNEAAREAVREYLGQCKPVLVKQFLTGCLKGATLSMGNPLGRTVEHFVEISSLTSNGLLEHFASPIVVLLRIGAERTRSKDQNEIAHSVGILQSLPDVLQKGGKDIFGELLDKAITWRSAVGRAVDEIRGNILMLMYVFTRLSFRKFKEELPVAQVREFNTVLFDIISHSRDSNFQDAAILCIGQMSLSGLLTPDLLGEAVRLEKLLETILEDAKKGRESAILALGYLSLSFSKEKEDSSGLFERLLSSMYGLHDIRGLEVQLTVGEALSVVAVGWASRSLLAAFDVDAERPESNIPPDVLSDMLDKILTDCKASKPSLKRASAVWLLSLVQYCGHCQQVQDRLRQCQSAFLWLLSDRDEIVQETASRGLGFVYEMGNQELKDDLVRDLVRSFTAEGSNLGGGKVSTDTELFEPGALPTGEGSITTYKDIVNLASEVGDPSLVYRFMSLASNNSVWSSRAAFGRFGLSSLLSDSSVNGYLAQNPKVYPKLYRYRFDPNPNVQKSMNDIWNALVKEPNTVINANFDAIMEDLLKNILAGKEWRVRQASCAAIADLIQGRPIEKYDKFLNDILNKAFKVLDDIKLTVREEAFKLCQVLSNILVRALEEGVPNSKKAQLMLQHIVPFLLQNGMESSVQEIQAYSILTMTTLVKKSPAETLRPFIPSILEKFLTSLSSVEPQAVNYIHLNADKYGLTGQQIDKMRLSAIRSSPMMESVELYLLDALDEASMEEVASKLEHVLRSAIGLPSKVGCSRVLVILSTKTMLFQPYADRFIQLTQKYVLDRNDTVSASYSNAIGYMTRLASDDEVLKTIAYARKLYFDSDDASHRAVAGEILYSMSKFANDRVNRVSVDFLPFIFVAMHDTDNEVKEFFSKTWNDNVSGSRVVSLYLKEMLGLVSSQLDSPRWAIKHASALAVARVVESLDKEIDATTAKAIWPSLEKALGGKSWEGKEKVLRAMVQYATRAKSCLEELDGVRSQMKTIAIREAKRNNAAYRPHAFRCLGEFGTAVSGQDLAPDAIKIVSQALEDYADSSQDKMDIDSSAKSRLSK